MPAVSVPLRGKYFETVDNLGETFTVTVSVPLRGKYFETVAKNSDGLEVRFPSPCGVNILKHREQQWQNCRC